MVPNRCCGAFDDQVSPDHGIKPSTSSRALLRHRVSHVLIGELCALCEAVRHLAAAALPFCRMKVPLELPPTDLGTSAWHGTFADALDFSQSLQDKLSHDEFRVYRASRFGRYRAVLQRLRERSIHLSMFEGGRFDRLLLQAMAEFTQLDILLRHLGPLPAWRSRIQEVFSGRELPEDDSKPHPRNLQFELLTAAFFRASGVPIQQAEPDVIISLDGWRLGVAAKRVSSRRALIDRVHEGSRQLERARLPGFVAVEVSRICNPRNALIAAPNDEAVVSEGSQLVEALLDEQEEALAKAVNREHVCGIICFSAIKGVNTSIPAGLVAMHRGSLLLMKPSSARFKPLFRLLQQLARSGLR